MKKMLQQSLLILLGWMFVLLGILGVFLPLLPTTVFLIIAMIIFSRCSPRFHRMLLENRWFGEGLRQWEQQKSVTRQTKRKATVAIIITFLISIAVLYESPGLQIMLVALAVILLTYLWRLNETPADFDQANS